MRALIAGIALATAAGAAHAQVPPELARIGHIVVIFEENRSFDNLFGHFPGANGLDNAGAAATQVNAEGKPYATLPPVQKVGSGPPEPDPRFPAQLPNGPFEVNPFVPPSDITGDLVHMWYQEQSQIDGGRMDRYAAVSNAGALTMGYFNISDSNQWKLASQYALGDAMFHSAFGGSFLNHAFLVCSCAFRWPNAPASLVATVDSDGHMLSDGQVTPDGYAVNTSRSVYLHKPSETDPSLLVPPQTMPHIGDRLDAKGVSWAWYSGGYADAAAGHPGKLFQFHHQPLAYFADLAPGTPGQKAHLKDETDLEADIAAGTLPQVAFYKPIRRIQPPPRLRDHLGGGPAPCRPRRQAAGQQAMAGHADPGHLRRERRPVGPCHSAEARPMGTRHAHPADRHRPDGEATFHRPHDLRFRLDPAHDRTALRRGPGGVGRRRREPDDEPVAVGQGCASSACPGAACARG